MTEEHDLPAIETFTWHLIRQGMAKDLPRHESPRAQILVAGGWQSSAFLRDLFRHDLDEREADDMYIDESDSDLDCAS